VDAYSSPLPVKKRKHIVLAIGVSVAAPAMWAILLRGNDGSAPMKLGNYNAGYVYRISGVAGLSGLLFGFDTAVINGALPFLRQQFRLTDLQVEFVAGALLLGAVLGALISGWVSDRVGRRRSLMFCAVAFAVASIYSAVPGILAELEIARFAAGIAIGMASALSPVYIAEVSPPGVRGRLVSFNQLAIVIGILIAYFGSWQLARLGPSSWRWMFAVAALPSIAYWIGLLGIPESPRWLAYKGNEEAALRILMKILPIDEAKHELADIRKNLIEESAISLPALFSTSLRRPMWLAIILAFLCQATGINTIVYYGSLLLQDHAGRSASSAIAANVLVGSINLAGTLLSMAVIDRFGRRVLLLVGSGGTCIALLVLGFAFKREQQSYLVIVVCILMYIFFFALSFGTVVWVYLSELFPNAARARAASIGTMVVWISCLAVTLTFLTLVRAAGVAGAYRIYAAMCAISFVTIWRFFPETKGKSLEEIQDYWRPSHARVETTVR
jgi:sugar porter (SP) family MFS transporter